MARVAVFVGEEGQPRGLGHFDDGGLAVAHDAPSCADGLSEGAGYAAGEGASRGGLDEGVQGAVAAVGHGREIGFRIGEDAEDSFPDGPRGFRAGDAAFEGLWRNYYSHDAELYNVVYWVWRVC